MSTAETAPTQFIEAANNVRFAYRRFGHKTAVPIVLHIHFRGSIDHWDPLFVNELAKAREVILFDNAGVGRSTGEVPTTFAGWAKDLVAFVQALKIDKVDLLGFSMGGLAVTEAALAAPALVRKLIIAGSRASVPSQGQVPGIVWPQDTTDPKFVTAIAVATTVDEGRKAIGYSFFPDVAGNVIDAYWHRVQQRSVEAPQLDWLPMDKGGSNQVAAIMDADVPKPGSSFDRLGELKMPVLVINGDDDVLVPTGRSWELLKMIDNAQLIIYPRSGHGFIWQYATKVGEDVNRFLDTKDFDF